MRVKDSAIVLLLALCMALIPMLALPLATSVLAATPIYVNGGKGTSPAEPTEAYARANLILNPGFEDPTGDGSQPPANWGYSTTSPYRDVPPNVHSGNYSAYLHGASGNYSQIVSVAAGTICRLQAYARANASGNETVTLTIRSSSGEVLDTHSWNGTDHGWAQRIDYLTTPEKAWDVVVTLAISGNESAEAWFDDIVLEERSPLGCFIATAAYGSSLDSHVDTLRAFRDQYLVTNPLGSAFVSLYYKFSPPLASFIESHPTFKPMVRAALLPAVALSTVAVKATPMEKIAIALVILSLLFVMRERRGQRKAT
jgi:hypothetical protein